MLDSSCVQLATLCAITSPISSISFNSAAVVLRMASRFGKWRARLLATPAPTWRIPKPKISRQRSRFLLSSIPSRKFCADFVNDFARLFNRHCVAYADVFAAKFIFIMQGRPANRAAREEDRLQFGDGRENTGPANLNGDSVELCLGLFRGVFVGDGPARGF